MPTTPNKMMAMPWAKIAKPFEYVHDKFYNTTAWRKFRVVYLSLHPLCVMCAENGITTAANTVDHITPLKDGGEHFEDSNLQALCKPCHSIKSVNKRWGK